MEVFTHALASLVLARAAIPRAPLLAWLVVVLAGIVADLDGLSALSGPATYIAWHYADTHSLAAALAAATALTMAYSLFLKKFASCRIKATALFATALLAACLHLAMDACQSEGVTLFWPFSPRRFAADWVAGIDPWIIAILLAAALLPELLHLVADEIGARNKSPRGRLGAVLGLAAVVFYFGVRATLHSNVVAVIESGTYRGESPHRAAAFPESASLVTWHGLVETESALHALTVNGYPGAPFDAAGAITFFKPEPSPALDLARNSDATKIFLRVARFPKASVEKTPEGYSIELRDLRYAAAGGRHEIVAIIKLDQNARILDDTLLWARDLRRR
jgi:membrane-bound metal-dependent hydrolase YbcI (DUF457 family)